MNKYFIGLINIIAVTKFINSYSDPSFNVVNVNRGPPPLVKTREIGTATVNQYIISFK